MLFLKTKSRWGVCASASVWGPTSKQRNCSSRLGKWEEEEEEEEEDEEEEEQEEEEEEDDDDDGDDEDHDER